MGQQNIRITHHSKRVVFPKRKVTHEDFLNKQYKGFERIWTIYPEETLYDSEILFYKNQYGKFLKSSNEKHKKARNYSRMIKIKDLYARDRWSPDILELKIGSKKDKIPKELLIECTTEYLQWLRKWSWEHNQVLHILNVLANNTMPYTVEIRMVWDYEEDGIRKVSRAKALEVADIPLPDPSLPESRANNRKTSFDSISRAMFYSICERKGIPVERQAKIYTLEKADQKKEEVKNLYHETIGRIDEMVLIEACFPENWIESTEHIDNGMVAMTRDDFYLLKMRAALSELYGEKEKESKSLLRKLVKNNQKTEQMAEEELLENKKLARELMALRVGLIKQGIRISETEDK